MITGIQMSDSIAELVGAVAAFQADLPKVAKANTADVQSQRGSYKYQYADLTDVSAVTLPRLAAHGLAWITMPNTDESGMLALDWMLAHTSGEFFRGSVPIGRTGDQWQEVGKAETYARRYCLVALSGVAPGGDDNDGEGASAGSVARPEPVREYLPEGLYDLSRLQTRKDAEEMFYRARGAGHLPFLVLTDAGAEVAFGTYLRELGGRLPAIADEDAPAEEAKAETEEEAERVTAQAPRADDDAPEGDR